jgi:serine protease
MKSLKYILLLIIVVYTELLMAQSFQIVVKTTQNKDTELQNLLEQLQLKALPAFPKHHANDKKGQATRLSDIYFVETTTEVTRTSALKRIKNEASIIYAEPKPIPRLFDTANDPNHTSQYYLGQMDMYRAWGVTQGDSTVVIGIVDTGTDLTHEDLDGKIAYNYADPVNGIDDDMDGFVDNFFGWDLSENNNYPQADANGHGVRVAGIAAAATNNEIGISGVGYNTTFLPVKTMNSEGQLNTAWEGIVYATDHGAQIIVCSWGGVVPTNFGQDVIDYATYDCNALVVAAAGNSNNEDIYYPASLPNVLSVAATNQNDQRWNGSTYGHTVDVSAPGAAIYATTLGNSYGNGWGTSFAAPAVAGVAALIKHQRPHLSALQIRQQIINTTYLLDTIPQNVLHAGKLGSGRVDGYQALTDTLVSGLELLEMELSSAPMPADTVHLTGKIINYLYPATVSASITSLSEYATVLDPQINFGIIGINSFAQINDSDLAIKIDETIPHDHEVTIQFALNDGKKIRKRFFSFTANQSWITITDNNLNMTAPANGRLGFNSLSPLQGSGIWIDNMRNIVWEAGIIHGNGIDLVTSTFLNATPFHITNGQTLLENTLWDFASEAVMTDTNKTNSMNINIEQQILASQAPELDRTFILNYSYINQSNTNYENFHAGLFFDWDLGNAASNEAFFDTENNIAFCNSLDGSSLYVGVKIINRPFHHYAFELNEETEGINITDGFTNEERWFALTNERPLAGGENGNDVAHMVSTNENTLNASDTLLLQVIFSVGYHQADVINSIESAERMVSELTHISKPQQAAVSVFPNPTKSATISSAEIIQTINVYDLSGNLLEKFAPKTSNATISTHGSGIYIIEIITKENSVIRKLIVQ